MSVTKHHVIALNAAHPDWTVKRVADALECSSEYVRATAQRNGLAFPRSLRRAAGPRHIQRAARDLLMALEAMRTAAIYLSAVVGHAPHGSLRETAEERLNAALAQAAAAIAKAHGEGQ